MAYGTIKVDTITFTNAGIDKSVTISGLVQNPTFTGNVTVTGTVSGATANFVSGVFTTQISGTTVTGGSANFTSGTFTNISGGVYTITSGVFALGASGTPSISFASDLNTGIYSPGADQVAISTAGDTRMIITDGGNVGIGVIGPLSTLSVGGNPPTSGAIGVVGSAGGIALALSDNTNSSLYVRTASGGAIIGTDEGGLIRFATGGNSTSDEKARIDASGRLLVGTSSDSGGALLQVNGNRIRVATAKTPASASDTGTAGEICWDASYIYVCTATNTWKRTAISTW